MFLPSPADTTHTTYRILSRFGRKKTLLSSLIAQIMFGTLIAFNPWFEAHCVLRFLLGFISVGIVFSGFVLCA